MCALNRVFAHTHIHTRTRLHAISCCHRRSFTSLTLTQRFGAAFVVTVTEKLWTSFCVFVCVYVYKYVRLCCTLKKRHLWTVNMQKGANIKFIYICIYGCIQYLRWHFKIFLLVAHRCWRAHTHMHVQFYECAFIGTYMCVWKYF